jgi:hypothetical protein
MQISRSKPDSLHRTPAGFTVLARSPRLMRSSRTARHAALVWPPMFLTANSTFWPSVLLWCLHIS